MSKKTPIGIFDSGIGGLTVLKEIKKILPEYDYLYLGDSARAPYGTRSFETVYEYTLQSVQKMFEMGCELVVLACNTASAKALRTIQQNDLPRIDPSKRVLGVIRPTSEIIGDLSKSKNIGIFATEGTVKSESYLIEIGKTFPDCKVSQIACPLWVPLIENNEIHTEGSDYYIKQKVEELLRLNPDIDTILLGCTHYPVISKEIERCVSKETRILSQGEIVAKSLKDYLWRHFEIEGKCSKGGETVYLTTENPEEFASKAKIFLKKEITATKIKL